MLGLATNEATPLETMNLSLQAEIPIKDQMLVATDVYYNPNLGTAVISCFGSGLASSIVHICSTSQAWKAVRIIAQPRGLGDSFRSTKSFFATV
jgi:hypothetical protein